MVDLITRVIDDEEILSGADVLVHPDLPNEVSGVGLRFSRSTLFVVVNPDDDSLSVKGTAPEGAVVHERLSNEQSWSDATGKPLLWAWTLINQQGYRDGVQLSFHEPRTGLEGPIIQLVGRASGIQIFTVTK